MVLSNSYDQILQRQKYRNNNNSETDSKSKYTHKQGVCILEMYSNKWHIKLCSELI